MLGRHFIFWMRRLGRRSVLGSHALETLFNGRLRKTCIDGGSGPTVDVRHAIGTMKMRTTFSNALISNVKISAKRRQECYNKASRNVRLSDSYET
jgi:hypothetical protein